MATVLRRQGSVVPAPGSVAVALASRQGTWLVSVNWISTAVGLEPRSRRFTSRRPAICPLPWL